MSDEKLSYPTLSDLADLDLPPEEIARALDESNHWIQDAFMIEARRPLWVRVVQRVLPRRWWPRSWCRRTGIPAWTYRKLYQGTPAPRDKK